MKDISEARQRQRAGLPLEPRHIEAVKAHGRRYVRCKGSFHTSSDLIAQWRAEAGQTGESLSAWIVSRVERTRRPDSTIQDVRTENQRLRDEITVMRRALGDLNSRNHDLEARNEAIERDLLDAMDQMLRRKEVMA